MKAIGQVLGGVYLHGKYASFDIQRRRFSVKGDVFCLTRLQYPEGDILGNEDEEVEDE